jgi:hypothetical protein
MNLYEEFCKQPTLPVRDDIDIHERDKKKLLYSLLDLYSSYLYSFSSYVEYDPSISVKLQGGFKKDTFFSSIIKSALDKEIEEDVKIQSIDLVIEEPVFMSISQKIEKPQ